MSLSIYKLRRLQDAMRKLKRTAGISEAPGWDAILTRDRRTALVSAIKGNRELDAETRARADEIVEIIETRTTPDLFIRG